jgi:hypothetical protein
VGTVEGLRFLKSLPTGTKAELELSNYPLLVAFADINDPISVKPVDPTNISTSFGSGFSLKGITLQLTDEKVTEGVVGSVLSWEKSLVGSIGKDMNLPYNHILNQINNGSFAIRMTQ